jgi:hypothetical protein
MLKLKVSYLIHNFHKFRNNRRLKRNLSVMNMLMTIRGCIYWGGSLYVLNEPVLSSDNKSISLKTISRDEVNSIIKSTLKLEPQHVNITNLRIFISRLITQTSGDVRLVDAYKSIYSSDTVTSGYYKVLEAFDANNYIKINNNLTNIRVLLQGFLTSGL